MHVHSAEAAVYQWKDMGSNLCIGWNAGSHTWKKKHLHCSNVLWPHRTPLHTPCRGKQPKQHSTRSIGVFQLCCVVRKGGSKGTGAFDPWLQACTFQIPPSHDAVRSSHTTHTGQNNYYMAASSGGKMATRALCTHLAAADRKQHSPRSVGVFQLCCIVRQGSSKSPRVAWLYDGRLVAGDALPYGGTAS